MEASKYSSAEYALINDEGVTESLKGVVPSKKEPTDGKINNAEPKNL